MHKEAHGLITQPDLELIGFGSSPFSGPGDRTLKKEDGKPMTGSHLGAIMFIDMVKFSTDKLLKLGKIQRHLF